MNYEERIPLNSLLAGHGHIHSPPHSHNHNHSQRSSHDPGLGPYISNRTNSRPLPVPMAEGSADILEHLISIVLQGNAQYLDKLLKNEEVLDVIDMQDNKGFTALHIASDKYDPDCSRLLLQAGADPNITDRYKRTALHWVVNGGCRCDACNTRRAKCAELLVAARVNLEAEDYEGETALYYAARNTLNKPAAVMLQNGAEISRCANGVSLGHLIVQKIPEVMVQLLDSSIAYDNEDNSKLKLDFGFNEQECVLKAAALIHGFLIDASRKDDEYAGIEGSKLRDANGKPRKETDLLNYMMKAHPLGREALLTHPITEAFLHLKWLYVRKWFWCTRIFYCLLTLIYTYFVFNLYVFTCPYYNTWTRVADDTILNEDFKCTHPFHMYILAICIGAGGILMIVLQLYKFCTDACNYLKNGINLGWWILIVCIGLTITPPLGLEMMEWQYPVAAFGVFYFWAMNLGHLNHLPYFGVYIEMLWKVLQKLAIVSATFASLFIAFALGFCVLFPEVGLFDQITKSIVKTTMMMLGDRDYPVVFNELEEKRLAVPQYAIPAHIFYFSFLFIFGVVLMNLLMGLAVSDIQILQRNAELSRVCRQITEISVLETFAAGKCLSSCFTRCILSRISVRSRNGRYFSFSPTDSEDKSFPTEIKTKFIPYMKSRPCLNKDILRRPLLSVNPSFLQQSGSSGRVFTHFRSQENLDDILNDLKNRLEGFRQNSPPDFRH